MNTRSRRKAACIGTQASELMFAAPQVVAQRLGRMAAAGPRPGARDRREFQRMGAEKVAAFGEAWQAMALQMLKSNQQVAASMMRSTWSASAMMQAAAAWQRAMLDVMGQGLAPVHRRAVANAKRLGHKR